MKNNILETELKFTEVYRKYQHEHPAIREAMCLQAEYPAYFAGIQQGDLFAGRISHGLVGFSPDEWGSTAFGYYCRVPEIENILKNEDLDVETRVKINRMLDFWKDENTSAKLRRSYPDTMARYLPTDDWMNESGISFPLYRLCGAQVDFDKLMKIGLPGLRKEIDAWAKTAKQDGKDEKFYEGALLSLDVLESVFDYYIDDAKKKILVAPPEEDKALARIVNSLEAVKRSAPKNLHEAAQLFWLYSLIGDIRNYGRMDVYLGDFLTRDLKDNLINEAEALKMLESLWRLMAARNTRVHGRIIIGGVGRRNSVNADRFALLAMEATKNVHEIEPQLSLRIYEGINPKLFDKALEVIWDGRTYPILYNDDVNVPSVKKGFKVSQSEAEQYVPFGCGEYIINHQSFGTPSGVINLLKALEITLHNGFDPVTRRPMGLALGEFKSFDTFDKLLAAYKKQVEFYVEMMAEHEALEYKIAGETAPFFFTSLLYDECTERGKGMFSGGIKYLGGTLETYGNTNTADSLTAIKKLVYDEKKITKEELLKALDANFNGYGMVRKQLKDAPKYGNDNDEADNMLLEVHNHVCSFVRAQAGRVGLHSYSVVIINNSANSLMGKSTAASADGRLYGTHMNNGNAPSGGNDQSGVTAMLNSVVKPDTSIHAGAVQNMKFNKRLLAENKDQVISLLRTYFKLGGAQAMITVVDRGELERALVNPEEYRDIFVRVGGFSARFVELDPEVQRDILNRTLY
jgi:pyruvate-formate lyase